MTVIGSSEEINRVLQSVNPGFPRQNLESIGSGECYYYLNGIDVKIELEDIANENGQHRRA